MNLDKYIELMGKDKRPLTSANVAQLKELLGEVAKLYSAKAAEDVLDRIYAEKRAASESIALLRQNLGVQKARMQAQAEAAEETVAVKASRNKPQPVEEEGDEGSEDERDENETDEDGAGGDGSEEGEEEGDENETDEDGAGDDGSEEGDEPEPQKKSETKATAKTGEAKPKKPKPMVASMLPNTRNRWIMAIGAILIIGAIMILSNSSGISAQQSNAMVTPPEVATEQTIKPVDVAHSDWTSPAQLYIIILGYFVARYCYKDADDRGEKWDAFMSFICAGSIFFFGWAWNAGIGIIVQSKLGLNPEQLKYFGAMYGAIFVFLTFGLIISFSRQGVKVDWTPFADFLALVGSGGLLFGDLGCIQLLLGFEHSYVLTAMQAWPLLLVKEKALVWMTVATYALLLASVYFYWKEVARFIKKADDPFMATLKSFAGIPLYIGLRTIGVWASNKYFGAPLPAVFLFFIFLASLGAASSISLELVKDEERAPVGKTESRLDKGFIIPYDRISLQLVLAILTIAALGTV